METLILLIVAFFFPPLAVGIKRGIDAHLALSIVLTIFMCWLPGVVHAFIIIANDPEKV